jgi:CheY-like chemotaxis protein
MGGSHIQVQSAIGEGSLFFFTLPVVEPPTPTSPLIRLESVQNVLIIDDNTVNTDVIKSILTKMRVNCDVAHSGAEGIQLIAAHKYDSVLLDLDMPDMSGFDTLRRLQELRTEGRTLPPVYAHSGDQTEEQVQACLAAGFTDFIEKPAPRSKLQTLLLRARNPI